MKRTLNKVLASFMIVSLFFALMPVPFAGATPSELFFSEYIEGTSNNKALEIYNGTGVAVNLATGAYVVQFFFNGSTSAGTTINLTGTVSDGDVYVIADNDAAAAILGVADQISTSNFYNGDDAIILWKGGTGGTVVDSIGQRGVDPGSEWGSSLTSTADNTLRRKTVIEAGDTDGTNAFDPSIEWDGFATNTFCGLGNIYSDCAPAVAATSPADDATNVARATDIIITFNEPVNASADSFTISCVSSGNHTFVMSGGPTVFTLNPDTDFAASETCEVTIVASGITDQDANDPPDTMTVDFTTGFTTINAAICGDPATFIHDVQGSGTTSPIAGAVVSIEGVVIADYQGSGQFGGYYVQEEDAEADADPSTSEGIFVFNTSFPVVVGDKVRVSGTVTEFLSSGQPLTELTGVGDVQICSTGNAVPSTSTVNLPVEAPADWESFEGMLINIPQTLTVTETFTLGRFGDVSLSVNGRLFNPTNVVEPGTDANNLQALNDRSRILLDDANNQQNIDPTLYPTGGLSASNTLRSGDTVNGLTGVLEQRFGVYRVQPVGAINFTAANLRTAAPAALNTTLKVASFNVLNYFNGDGFGGGFPTSRGANTAAEFTRQRDKIISAITTMDADIIGLMEIENDEPGNSAIEDLVDGLNAASVPGTYAFINTGIVGTDEIRVALIYKTATVTPFGAFAILDSTVDSTFIDTLNRPTLAQTFQQNSNGALVTVVVNHLKSKGSSCNFVGDPDTGDGQGNCNLTRANAATAMVNWLATDPTGAGDTDYLIIGDLNSYAMEDPITAIINGGYTNLLDSLAGAYSYVFQGQSGYLDHALASSSLTPQVTGITEWHINADEPTVMDYNMEFKTPNHVNSLYATTPFRSSDHDPVIVGLCTPPTASASATPSILSPANHKYVDVATTVLTSSDTASIELVSVTSNEPDDGDDDGNTVDDIVIIDDFNFQLRAERSGVGTGRIYTITYLVTNTCGATTTGTATVTVPLSHGN